MGGAALILRVNGVREHHAFIILKSVQQRFVGLDMSNLRCLIRAQGQRFGFLAAKTQSTHQLDRLGFRVGDVKQFSDDGANLIGRLRSPFAKQGG